MQVFFVSTLLAGSNTTAQHCAFSCDTGFPPCTHDQMIMGRKPAQTSTGWTVFVFLEVSWTCRYFLLVVVLPSLTPHLLDTCHPCENQRVPLDHIRKQVLRKQRLQKLEIMFFWSSTLKESFTVIPYDTVSVSSSTVWTSWCFSEDIFTIMGKGIFDFNEPWQSSKILLDFQNSGRFVLQAPVKGWSVNAYSHMDALEQDVSYKKNKIQTTSPIGTFIFSLRAVKVLLHLMLAVTLSSDIKTSLRLMSLKGKLEKWEDVCIMISFMHQAPCVCCYSMRIIAHNSPWCIVSWAQPLKSSVRDHALIVYCTTGRL